MYRQNNPGRRKEITMKENLFTKNGESYKKEAFSFCEGYKSFLSYAKTERLCADYFKEKAKKNGFINIEEKTSFKKGDKVYYINNQRSAIFAVIGEEPLENGINLIASHIDSPRLDLKPSSITEDTTFAYFRTHYYGGIKKYQWVALPLAIYGVVIKKDGTKVSVSIGDNENDPVFMISDILPHLASKQMGLKMSEGITGEKLMVIAGSDEADCDKDKLKTNLLNILKEKYDIEEEDLYSAELQVVPAGAAKDLGFDRSLVAGYGHDDRVCAYPSFEALLKTQNPKRTAVILLADREEVGSMGNSGMQSTFLQYFLEEIEPGVRLNKLFKNTFCLSSDVAAAFDPVYPEVYEKQNSSICGCGLSLLKYTGSRGKSGSSEASAEFIAYLRNIFDKDGVAYQFAELGKVDEGGGGTVAQYIANLGAQVIDAGVGLLSMHAPFEIAHKADIYETYKAYISFFGN